MNDHADIEQAIVNLRFEIPQQVDKRILNDSLQALDETFNKTAGDVPSGNPSNNGSILVPSWITSRKRILRSPWRKAVAAAIPAAAAALIFILFHGKSSITLADVRAAVAEQSWVHLKYDNGRERWISLRDGRRFYQHENRYVDYFDYDRGVRRIYRGVDFRKIYESHIEPEEKPTDAWDAALGWYERSVGKPKNAYEVEKHTETVNGQRLIRFDTYYTDVQGRRLLSGQTWANPDTRLPVWERHRLQRHEREEQNREWITGTYNFPETGPTSLYDLGVPRDAEIVRRKKIPLTPEVQAIVEAARLAREQFPTNYRTIIWPAGKSGSVNVVYRDGEKIRRKQYNIMSAHDPQYKHAYLPLPASAEQVLQWVQTQEPVNQWLIADRIWYFRWRPFFEGPSPATVEIRRDLFLVRPENCPTTYQWPYTFKSNLQILADAPNLPIDCIALRRSFAEIREDYYLDPSHDYICFKKVEWRKEDGEWKRYDGITLSEYARLPSGQWYATRRSRTHYSRENNDITRESDPYHIDIKLMSEGEYPVDTFDTQRILEGAAVQDY